MNWLSEPVFRPPAEAESLIFQIAYGCPHNTCRFCGMYKGVVYRERTSAEIFAEIDRAAADPFYRRTRRIFLADGDAMMLPFPFLEQIMRRLKEKFPLLSRITMYANGSSILKKSDEELKRLREWNLAIVYVGLESGSEALLKAVGKDDSAAHMTEAVRRIQASGVKASVMILAGVGGKTFHEEHVRDTVSVLNRMQPRILSLLRFIEVPGLRMFDGYQALSEYDSVLEIRRIIDGLRLDSTVFRANHASVPFPLEGRFPKDRANMTALLDRVLAGGGLDRTGAGRIPMYL